MSGSSSSILSYVRTSRLPNDSRRLFFFSIGAGVAMLTLSSDDDSIVVAVMFLKCFFDLVVLRVFLLICFVSWFYDTRVAMFSEIKDFDTEKFGIDAPKTWDWREGTTRPKTRRKENITIALKIACSKSKNSINGPCLWQMSTIQIVVFTRRGEANFVHTMWNFYKYVFLEIIGISTLISTLITGAIYLVRYR